MKIKETIERECCQNQDLKKYRGDGFKAFHDVHFCSFCGQLWHWKRLPGEMDACWNKIVIGDAVQPRPDVYRPLVSKPCNLQETPQLDGHNA